jgi:hypothetical protein
VTAITIPILPSADFDITTSFWSSFGFREIGRWVDEYLILRHEELAIELHFWHDPTVDRWTNDVGCYVRFDTPESAAAQHAVWSTIQVPHPATFHPLRTEPWGATEFSVIDLHGNLVRLGGFPVSR